MAGAKHPIDLETRWNFGDSRSTSLSLDESLAQKEADGVEFFAGKEPWLVQILEHIHKVRGSSTFFRGRLDFSLKEYGPQHLATLDRKVIAPEEVKPQVVRAFRSQRKLR